MLAHPQQTVPARAFAALVSLIALTTLTAFTAWPRDSFAAGKPCDAQAAMHGACCCCGAGGGAAASATDCARTCSSPVRAARSVVDDRFSWPDGLAQTLPDSMGEPPSAVTTLLQVPVARPVGPLFLFNRALLL